MRKSNVHCGGSTCITVYNLHARYKSVAKENSRELPLTIFQTV